VSELVWRKSSYSHTNGCVEVAFTDDGEHVCVRNSRLREHLRLTFTRAEWNAFEAGVRAGEFGTELGSGKDGEL
jgi:hypothetical protein